MMKLENVVSVALINPPQQHLLEGFPGSLVPLADYVATHEPTVRVVLGDLGTTSQAELEKAVTATIANLPGVTIVGITTTTASYQAALAVARNVKKVRPEAFVVFGGHHASAQDRVILEQHLDDVDAVIRDEGELALLSLVQNYPNLERVPGLTWRGPDGLHRNGPARLLSVGELDALRIERFAEQIHTAPGKFHRVTYVSARGCPLSCHFCSVANAQIRAKSVSRIVEDLRFLIEDRGARQIALEDNFFAASRLRTIEVCEAIERLQSTLSDRFSWDCQTRVESIRDQAVLAAMERAGCDAVYVGVESLVDEHLRYLGKTVDPDRYLRILAQEAIPNLLETNIAPYINLQLGLPGETAAHRDTMIAFLARLGGLAAAKGRAITVFPQLHVVYPGTRHFHDAIAQGRFGGLGEAIFETFTAWESVQQPVLNWLGEHFAHGTGGIPVGILNAALLMRNEFVIDANAVLAVSACLTRMAELDGIVVFQYGQYLAHTADESPRADPRAL